MTPEAVLGAIIVLTKRGAVTISVYDPVRESESESERFDLPYVCVTADGETWRQPIRRRALALSSTPNEIADAIAIAIDMHCKRAGA